MDAFDACRAVYTREELRGQRCYGGLDLARVRDLSAFALLFPPSGDREKWRVLKRVRRP